jgi:hypothetical protein
MSKWTKGIYVLEFKHSGGVHRASVNVVYIVTCDEVYYVYTHYIYIIYIILVLFISYIMLKNKIFHTYSYIS